MHHHHHESLHHESGHATSKIDQDENSVTKWLNTMESCLANPNQKFDIRKFSDNEIHAINTYMHSHQQSLARYDQFLPHAKVSEDQQTLIFNHHSHCEK